MKRMASGGMAEKPKSDGLNLDPDKQKAAEDGMRKAFGGNKDNVKPLAMGGMADSEMGAGMPGKPIPLPCEDCDEMHDSEMDRRMAHGGMADNPLMRHSAADSIMKKRMMAEGGMVDLELNAEEMPAGEEYDSLNQEAALKENYDEGMHESASDKDDMAERIRRKRMMKG